MVKTYSGVMAYLDSTLSFKDYIKVKCTAAMLNLLKFRAVRKYLTRIACAKLTISLIISRLDYANVILAELPKVSLDKLQRVTNMATKIVLNKGKYDSSTRCLEELHWLPIEQRINFKIATLVHKCIEGKAPSYLDKIIIKKIPRREGMRSSTKSSLLEITHTTRKTFAARSFSIMGPEIWNGLPDKLRKLDNYSPFKKVLKTHLFKVAFQLSSQLCKVQLIKLCVFLVHYTNLHLHYIIVYCIYALCFSKVLTAL